MLPLPTLAMWCFERRSWLHYVCVVKCSRSWMLWKNPSSPSLPRNRWMLQDRLGDGEPGTGKITGKSEPPNGRAPGASALHLAVLGGHLVFAQAREICATKQTDVGNEKEEMLNWTASLYITKGNYSYILSYIVHTHTPLLVFTIFTVVLLNLREQ